MNLARNTAMSCHVKTPGLGTLVVENTEERGMIQGDPSGLKSTGKAEETRAGGDMFQIAFP